MDILSALNDANPQRGTKRCKLQRVLDDIPAEANGKGALVSAVNATPDVFAAQKLTLTFSALGAPVAADLIRDHRAKRCACYR